MKQTSKKILFFSLMIFIFLGININSTFGEGTPNCNEISWKDVNICSWKVSSDLEASGDLNVNQTITSTLAGETIEVGDADVCGNIWVIYQKNGSWEGGTFERLRPKSTFVDSLSKNSRDFYDFYVKNGEVFGIVVTGLARSQERNRTIRSKIAWGRFKGGKFVQESSETNIKSKEIEVQISEDCKKVSWKEGDICTWTVVSDLENINFLGDMDSDSGMMQFSQEVNNLLSNKTYKDGNKEVSANVWVIGEDDGSWKGSTFERLEANNNWTKSGNIKEEGLGHSMIEGHTYGFVVTGLIRNGVKNNEKVRSRIIWGKYQNGSWQKTGSENVIINEEYIGGGDGSYTVPFGVGAANGDIDRKSSVMTMCDEEKGGEYNACKIKQKAIIKYYLNPTKENKVAISKAHLEYEYIDRNGNMGLVMKHNITGINRVSGGVVTECNNGQGGFYDVSMFDGFKIPKLEVIGKGDICGDTEEIELRCGGLTEEDKKNLLKETMGYKWGYEWNNGQKGETIKVFSGRYTCKAVFGEDILETEKTEEYKVEQHYTPKVTIDGETDIETGSGSTGTTELICNVLDLNNAKDALEIKWYNVTGLDLETLSNSGSTETNSGTISSGAVETNSGTTNSGDIEKEDPLKDLEILSTEKTIEVGTGTYICRATSEEVCSGEDEVSVLGHKKPLPMLSCDVDIKSWEKTENGSGKLERESLTTIPKGEKYTFTVKSNRGDVKCIYSGIDENKKPVVKEIYDSKKAKLAEITTPVASNVNIECNVEYLNKEDLGTGSGTTNTGVLETASCSDTIKITNDSIYPTPNCTLDFEKDGETIDSYVKLREEIKALYTTDSEITKDKCYYTIQKITNTKTKISKPVELTNGKKFKLSKTGEENKNKEFNVGNTEEKRIYTCIVENEYENTGTCSKTLIFSEKIPEGYCGDGKVQKPNKNLFIEQCDSTIGCTDTCRKTKTNGYCGDGIVQISRGETCDGGTNCSINCGLEKQPIKERDPKNPNDKDYNPNNGYDPSGKSDKNDNDCGQYISGYKEVATPCVVNGEWNSKTNSVECAQEVKFQAIWKNTPRDAQGNCNFTIAYGNAKKVPLSKSTPRGGLIKINYLGNDCRGKYADGKQTCKFHFELKLDIDAPNENKPKIGITGINKIWVGDFKYDGAYIDQTLDSTKQESGLLFKHREKIKEVTTGGQKRYLLDITAKSVVPFKEKGKTLSFNIEGLAFINEVKQIIPSDEENKIEFLTPLKINDLSINSIPNNPELGRDQFYDIGFNKTDTSVDLSLSNNFKLFLEKKYILVGKKINDEFKNSEGYKKVSNVILNKKFEKYIDGKNNEKEPRELLNAFKLKIDSSKNNKEEVLNGGQAVNLKRMPIGYTINDKIVKYIINPTKEVLLSGCKKKTNGLLVEGGIQFDGKGEISGQTEKYTDLSSSSMRNIIRKNAYKLLKGRENKVNRKIGTVYYNREDTKYSEIKSKLSSNDTIIIKDGNFIIDEDIKERVGIIVLYDKYSIKDDKKLNKKGNSDKGNIYIDNRVKEIEGIIYTDGAVLSRNARGGLYEDGDLTEQLIINGSLFSRNTVGGAVSGIGEELNKENVYKLPGGLKTRDFMEAEMYDLDYLRKVDLCNKEYSTKIKYNSKFQLNPPKGFGG